MAHVAGYPGCQGKTGRIAAVAQMLEFCQLTAPGAARNQAPGESDVVLQEQRSGVDDAVR